MYTIKRTDRRITSIWDKNWDNAELADVNICNWEDRKSDIHMTAKVMYDDNRLYVRMETDEKMPIARQTEQNSMVCNDSCMEFFISPNENDPRYINFEFNPYGTMYVSVRKSRHEWEFTDEDRDYFEVQSHVDNKKWVIQFVLPFEYADKYLGGHTKNMKGNFYKCGEKDGKRHNLTYYLVDVTPPDFHTPQFFGDFILE
jgi:hypothetical protein